MAGSVSGKRVLQSPSDGLTLRGSRAQHQAHFSLTSNRQAQVLSSFCPPVVLVSPPKIAFATAGSPEFQQGHLRWMKLLVLEISEEAVPPNGAPPKGAQQSHMPPHVPPHVPLLVSAISFQLQWLETSRCP